MPSFYNGKQFFLTYPRCERSADELAQFLQSVATCSYYLIARELHEDGTPHLHACVQYVETLRGGVRLLDFEGHHPNKQDPRKWEACKQYCKKGGDFIEGPPDAIVRAALAGLAPSEVVRTFTDKAMWFDWCISKRITHGYAEWYWNSTREHDLTIDKDTVVAGQMCESLAGFAFDRDQHRVIVLKGESGCGKTTWAKTHAPKPALFVSHIDSLKRFQPGFHKSIIFDDVDFNHYPRTGQIHIADWENPRAIHVRYGTVEIPANTYKIFTCNFEPLTLTDEAIKRRVKVFHVK